MREKLALLTLEELAARTDVPEATLLGWGADHGFPRPALLDGPRGLYAQELVSQLRQVVAERTAGAPLREALARAKAAGTERSVFAAVVSARPKLTHHVLDKAALLAVSRVLEDEAHREHDDVLLVGGFQRERFYRQSAGRWRELAGRCRCTVAFADLPQTRRRDGVLEVEGSWDDPFIREWFLLVHSPAGQTVLAARERPVVAGTSDDERVFEAVWTTDAAAVRAGLLAVRTRLPEECGEVRELVAARVSAPGVPPAPDHVERVMQRAFAAHAQLAGERVRWAPVPTDPDPPTHRALAARLHDDTLQLLLAVRQDLEELRADDPRALRRAQGSLARAIAEVRDIVAGAPAPGRERAALPQELAAVAARVRERTGIAVETRVDDDVPEQLHALIADLARELATNSGLHAHATTVTIEVVRDAHAVTLTVRDDGFGFSAGRRARAAARGHRGLPLARERVEAAGGTLEVDGHALGGGARVVAVLPVPAA